MTAPSGFNNPLGLGTRCLLKFPIFEMEPAEEQKEMIEAGKPQSPAMVGELPHNEG